MGLPFIDGQSPFILLLSILTVYNLHVKLISDVHIKHISDSDELLENCKIGRLVPLL